MNAVACPPVSIEALESATVDPNVFNHAAHVYAAWLYLECWPLSEATPRYSAAIRRLTEKLGAEMKYHETITCFFMQLINERRARMAQPDWFRFQRANPDLMENAAASLDRYYSKSLLGSELARQHFLLPDRICDTGA